MPSWLITVLFVALIGFLLYRRFRRTLGRQRFSPYRMMGRIALLAIVSALSLVGLHTPAGIGAAVAGAIVGTGVSIFSLRHTMYEVTPEGAFYKTNAWFGLAILALFLGRFAARMSTLYLHRAELARLQEHAQGGPFSAEGLQRSPWTLGILFLMAAYYINYYVGLLRKHKTLALPEKR